MYYDDVQITGDAKKGFSFKSPTGPFISGHGGISDSCDCGVIISKNSVQFGFNCKSVFVSSLLAGTQ